MVTSYVGPAEATAIAGEFRRLEKTVETVFWDVTWTAWTKDRPAGTWDSGAAAETWTKGGTGTGRLRANGPGGPAQDEGVIFPESPYRLRTLAASVLDANAWLVIEGLLFKVDAFKDRAGDRTHADAYLTEVVVPEAQMPSAPEPEP